MFLDYIFMAALHWEISLSKDWKLHRNVFHLELLTLMVASCWVEHQDLFTDTSGSCTTRCDHFMATLSFVDCRGKWQQSSDLEMLFGQRAVLFSLSGPHMLRIQQLGVKKDETSKKHQLEWGPKRCHCTALTLQPSPAASRAVQNGGGDFTVTWAGSGTGYIP